jgi:pimeloyl-ACP methyl ester carboxylesterase
MRSLLAAANAPVRLARGEFDGLVSLAELRRDDPDALELSGLGHNAHVEDPERVLRLAERMRGD